MAPILAGTPRLGSSTMGFDDMFGNSEPQPETTPRNGTFTLLIILWF